MLFSITLENPGDAAVFAPLKEGAVKAGIRIGCIYDDSAYDTIANWMVIKNNDIKFYPNLKKTFGKNLNFPKGTSRRQEERR